MCTINNISSFEKWGAIIGLVGGIIGAVGGGFTIYDRLSQSALDVIGIAPVAVRITSQDTEAIFQGISLIIRVQNNGNKPTYFSGADIHGKVYLSYDEYWPVLRQNNYSGTSEDMKSDFMKLKPYILISWVGWISDQKGPLRIEPEEEKFIKITVAEPTLMWGVTGYAGSRSDYIGYERKGEEAPKYVNHNPAIQWFFSFTSFNQVHRIQDIREEVRNGLIKIEVRFGNKSKSVDRDKIIDIKSIPKGAWDEYPARKLYFDL